MRDRLKHLMRAAQGVPFNQSSCCIVIFSSRCYPMVVALFDFGLTSQLQL
ncbi:hypothetical protein Hanom_Chr06g00530621 [Helianthus anomalus]